MAVLSSEAISADAYLRVCLCTCVRVYACALCVRVHFTSGSLANEAAVALTRCLAVMNTIIA